MLLGEIPKTDNVLISFDLADKHFDFTTTLLPNTDKENPKGKIITEPVVIQGNSLHIDSRCRNQALRYLNPFSGRTHEWKDVSIQYVKNNNTEKYEIFCDRDSIPVNRRGAVRIPLWITTECTVSGLEGRYPCDIYDISVTGVGINIDVELAEKHLLNRLIYTHFEDVILDKKFFIKCCCLRCTPVGGSVMRAGCEIINVTPSINEYINERQTHKLFRHFNIENTIIK